MQKYLFIILFLSSVTARSQGFSDLGDKFEDRSIKVFWRLTSVKPDADDSYGGWTFNASLCLNSAEKKASRVRYENPTLGDMFFVLARMINGKPLTTKSGLEHAYGSGFFGWLQWHSNVVAKDKFLLSPGVSMGDYIIGIERKTSDGQIRTYDPAGYMFHIGPSLLASYAIGGGFWIDGYVNYDMVYGKVKYSRANYTPIDGYKKPHFVSFGFDLHHKSCFFGGIRINSLIDRGPNNIKASRMDISVGVWL